jgi:hypothetical protein
MPHLRPCKSCSRHVRADEARCPFCSAELETALPQAFIDGRLSRAAIMAVGTALAAGTLGGCGNGVGDSISVAPAYGGPPQPMPRPPTPDDSASAATTASLPSTAAAPVTATASATATAGVPATATATATTKKAPPPATVMPAYGAPPPRRP